MTLPVSGPISLSQVNVELGLASNAAISMGNSNVRTLFGKASGAISMSDGYGKANQFAFTISSNQTNANLRTLAINAGWNQASKVVATINSGVYVSSNSTGTPALLINGSFPGGVELINNGIVVGMGGNGGNGAVNNTSGAVSGGAGGLALSVGSAVSITNNGTIAGGGGGGGGGGSAYWVSGDDAYQAAGGGGGGGRSSNAANSSGGGGGNSGGGGTVSSAGGGGGRRNAVGGVFSGYGGNGGDWGSAGASGVTTSPSNYGYFGPAGGGSGGGSVSGNSNVTWVATGTRLGSIS